MRYVLSVILMCGLMACETTPDCPECEECEECKECEVCEPCEDKECSFNDFLQELCSCINETEQV